MSNLTLLLLRIFSVLISIVIASLEKERARLYASHAFACLIRMFLSLGVKGLTAACHCGTPWTFHFTF